MPQFRPYWWINLISWTFVIIAFFTWYNQSINFPKILRIKLSRMMILFNY